MHTITIQQNDTGTFDVLINGFSYRIHRNLTAEKATGRASDIKAEFAAMKQRATIKNLALAGRASPPQSLRRRPHPQRGGAAHQGGWRPTPATQAPTAA